MKHVLTDKLVQAIKPGPSRIEKADGGFQGLYLIVQPSGTKGWAVRDRTGKKHTISGYYPGLSLKDARKAAGAILTAIAEGRDPAAEKKEQRLNSVDAVLDDFLKRHVEANNRTGTARDVRNTLNREIRPLWKTKRIEQIRRRDIIALLDGMVDRGVPAMAASTYRILRKFFNWCCERGILTESPLDKLKAPATVASRDRVLTDAELRLAWRAAGELGWPFGPVFQLLAATGQRREEVAGMRWDEIDLDTATWTLPPQRAKNNREHHVPLTPLSLEILQSLPRVSDTLVFASRSDNSVSGFSRAKERMDAIMARLAAEEAAEAGTEPIKITAWRLHDFRRTSASGMASLGVPPHVVEAILNHKSGVISGVAAIYNKYDLASERRHALTLWSDRIKTIVEGDGGKVIPFPHGKKNR